MLRASLLVSLALAAHGCTTDADCSLNGVCTAGACACDAAWGGADCGVLRLLPTPKLNGIDNSSTTCTWGGSSHHDEASGKWYMFVSEFVNHCGLANWTPNSRVIRTVSTNGPLGPYTFDGEVLPTFHHNPQVLKTSNGSYVMYVIGRDCAHVDDCTNGPKPGPILSPCPIPGDTEPPTMESGITAYVTDSLTGPWTKIGKVLGSPLIDKWDADTTNPGPYIHQNGSVLLMYRGCGYYCLGGSKIGFAIGSHYSEKKYERITKDHSICDECRDEDPFVWQDTRGNYHALLHNLMPNGKSNCHQDSNGKWVECEVGTHIFSADGFDWKYSPTIPYNTSVEFTDGSSAILHRRERPQIIFQNGSPAYLINGITHRTNSDRSSTLIVPINTQ